MNSTHENIRTEMRGEDLQAGNVLEHYERGTVLVRPKLTRIVEDYSSIAGYRVAELAYVTGEYDTRTVHRPLFDDVLYTVVS